MGFEVLIAYSYKLQGRKINIIDTMLQDDFRYI